MAYQTGGNPLFDTYDAELHAITEKFRKQHPDWWFSYSGAKAEPVVKQTVASSKHGTRPLTKAETQRQS